MRLISLVFPLLRFEGDLNEAKLQLHAAYRV
jgi:hypothetical protein